MHIKRYDGDREALRPLFRLADDSEQHIGTYLKQGEVLVAADGDELVGHVQLVADHGQEFELTSVAVVESRRGQGIGRELGFGSSGSWRGDRALVL